MFKTYTTLSNAKRALKNISTAALQHAADLIEEKGGKFILDIAAAEAYEATLKEVWEEEAEERTPEERNSVFEMFNSAPAPVAAPVEEVAVVTEADKEIEPFGFETHGLYRCPSCGIHLDNGVGYHMQEVNGKYIKHEKYEFECMACGEEFGPAIPGKKAKTEGARAVSETQAVSMKTSLKLDRTIVWLNTGEEYKNAYQMWKNNPAIMTSSQQDTLTAKLYAAAKEGVKLVVTVNGNDFQLKNV